MINKKSGIEVTKIEDLKWYIKDNDSELAAFLSERWSPKGKYFLEIFNSNSKDKMYLKKQKRERFENKEGALDCFRDFIKMKSSTRTNN